jgi:hypothetical protein
MQYIYISVYVFVGHTLHNEEVLFGWLNKQRVMGGAFGAKGRSKNLIQYSQKYQERDIFATSSFWRTHTRN